MRALKGQGRQARRDREVAQFLALSGVACHGFRTRRRRCTTAQQSTQRQENDGAVLAVHLSSHTQHHRVSFRICHGCRRVLQTVNSVQPGQWTCYLIEQLQ